MADQTGAEMLGKEEIQNRIREYQKLYPQEAVRDFVMRILERMAESDPTEFVQFMLHPDDTGLQQQMNLLNVSEIKVGKNELLELKFADRLKILEKLMEISESGEESPLAKFCEGFSKSPEAEEAEHEE